MKIMGIEFAPLNTPVKRRFETLVVGISYFYMAFGGFVGMGIALLLLYFNFWFSTLLYLTWIWYFDKNICEEGGRSVNWVRSCILWKNFRDYFPINLTKTSDDELDPKQNYLFCSFPHGLLATGVWASFGTTACGFHKLFPNHKPHILTLQQNFSWPFFRDYILSVGMCSASAKSINWLMGKSEGGNIAILIVGGAAESFYSRPGKYCLVLKNRKGFVKLALRNGSPLVPVFNFGETDIFDQVDNPEGSTLRSIQEWIKKKTGVAPIIPIGRGYLQYSFGIVPMRKPISTIVGKPIDVKKTENPTQEQIDNLHGEFIKQLTELFEKQKHKYLPNADQIKLDIVYASADSLNWLLKYPGGGQAPVLIVGGTAEAFHCKPGQYRLVLKNRKGFIRLAMQNGSALVPVFSFGETDIYDQVDNPIGSRLRRFQDWVKKKAGIAPIIPVGRGFLQYSYGWVPHRRRITTVVGKPLEVGHIENPTKEEIDNMHDKFVHHLIQFFEENKHKYLENPEKTELLIE